MTGGASSRQLPDFPWDTITAAKTRAESYRNGIVNLSVGTPVDPTPPFIREAMAAASDAPGYPTVAGTPALTESIAGYLERRFGAAVDPDATLPTIGSKELVAWLPLLLGLGAGDTIAIPPVAYPTYAVGAVLAGTRVVSPSSPAEADGARLVWLNSPSNPTGRIADQAELRAWVTWARETGAVLVGDECYAEFGWEAEPLSLLSDQVSGGDHRGLLVLHSLSKRSNLAGYRAGLVAGDRSLIAELREVRKHAGMIVPAPVQAAMQAALGDQSHVEEQRDHYRRRRSLLSGALTAAGFRIEDSQGSLYLWASRDENCRETLDWLAQRGILVAPGDFYGTPESGAHSFVRVALTATDERITAAAERLNFAH